MHICVMYLERKGTKVDISQLYSLYSFILRHRISSTNPDAFIELYWLPCESLGHLSVSLTPAPCWSYGHESGSYSCVSVTFPTEPSPQSSSNISKWIIYSYSQKDVLFLTKLHRKLCCCPSCTSFQVSCARCKMFKSLFALTGSNRLGA